MGECRGYEGMEPITLDLCLLPVIQAPFDRASKRLRTLLEIGGEAVDMDLIGDAGTAAATVDLADDEGGAPPRG